MKDVTDILRGKSRKEGDVNEVCYRKSRQDIWSC